MIEIIGPGAYIPKEKTLVLGDLHIGSDYVLASGGAISPLIGITEIKEILDKLIAKVNPNRIVLLGDIQVSFGPVSLQEKREIKKLIEHLKQSCNELILIRGNHDKGISALYEFRDTFFLNGYFMTHGDIIREHPKETHTILIGHEHPAISISNDIRTEKFKCSIETTYKRKKLYILPSVNQLTLGTDISKEKLLSPYLADANLHKAKITVVEGIETYDFGNAIY